jgi:hypothetical protein
VIVQENFKRAKGRKFPRCSITCWLLHVISHFYWIFFETSFIEYRIHQFVYLHEIFYVCVLVIRINQEWLT